MTSPSDFADLFDPCRNPQDVNNAYKKGIAVLMEAYRLQMAQIVRDRDLAAGATPTKWMPQNASEGVEKAVQRSRDTTIRRWAQQQGIVFQRVNKGLRAMYDEAHPE